MTSTYYQEYKGTVLTLARSYFPNEEDAEDASQEVFIKLLSVEGKVPTGWHEKAWVYTVAENFLKDLKRKDVRAKRLMLRAAPLSDEMVNHDDPLNHAIQEEMGAVMLDNYGRLPRRYREIVSARLHEGLSYKDISDKFNIPINTVASRINRARAMLEEDL